MAESIDNKTNPFVHLHVHSHYSILDGMSSIDGLVDKAVACGMPAIALTDHGAMFGIKEFYNYVKKKNKTTGGAFKPILGVEAYVARRSRHSRVGDKNDKTDRGGWHLILLAKNKTGYKNLCKLVSASWIEGYYYKPRIDKELLQQYHEGLIVCSACLGGEIPQKLLGGSARDVDDDENSGGFEENIRISEENILAAEASIQWFKQIFGDDFYLEIQRHQTNKEGADTRVFKLQQAVNTAILDLAKRTNTKVIATNDVHFVEEEHAEAHDRLICLSTGKSLDDPKRMRYTKQEWLKTPDEMAKIFADVPEALTNTLEIVDKIETFSIDSAALMPAFDIPADFGTVEEYKTKITEDDLKSEFGANFDKLAEDGLDKLYRIKLEADYLEKLTMEGATMRYGDTIPEDVMERIQFELSVMKTMGFPGYFLIVQDFINAGRKEGISFGPGRGSAAGSVVAYCLKITDLDPLKYDLLFERFLNPDRISMPDIDVDIEADGRGRVLQYVIEKYGAEKVARIITFGTMASKSSIKDVARVQEIDLNISNQLAALVPQKFDENDRSIPRNEKGDMPKVNLANCYKYIQEFRTELNSGDTKIVSTLEYAKILEGTVRQTGVHACGVIIGADDLSNFVPLSTADDKETKEKVPVTQYEGVVIEEVGLIKMDFLGLETLDIIKGTLKNIKATKGVDLDIDGIPNNDPATYEIFTKGQTTGIFQFESAGMQKYLKELQPTCLEDLIAMNALYRPGPMQYIPSFINRKHGREPISYDIPIMEKRLEDTYGITVYQEQVMLLSRDLAGFTRGQSDELRKAMGKKMIDKMAALKEKFLAGGKANGHDEKILEKIWNDWAEFAKYAFNKSHSTCYAWLAYQTAYLKAHYPSEFMAAILTRSLNDIKEVSKLMDECKSMGINVLGPDVNESVLNFNVNSKGDIRFGLGGVKGIGSGAVETIVKERENGAFKGIFDFVERVNMNACNKKVMESLCLSGAFDNFPELIREQYFAEIGNGETGVEMLIRYGSKFQTDQQSSQNSLFGGFDTVAVVRPNLPKVAAWNKIERLNKEKDMIGIYLSAHPLDDYYITLKYICNTQMSDFEDAKTSRINQHLIMGGIVTGCRVGLTKKGNNYAIITIEDFSGSGEIALFGKDYESYSRYGVIGAYLLIEGKFAPDKYSGRINFNIQSIQPLEDEEKRSPIRQITIAIPLSELTDELINDLSAIVKNKQGNTTLYFRIEDSEKRMFLLLIPNNQNFFINKKIVNYLEDKEYIKFKINE